MIEEAITKIQEMAVKATALEVKPLPNDPYRVIVSQAGAYSIVNAPFVPPKRSVSVQTLESFAEAYSQFGAVRPVSEDPAGEPAQTTAVSTRVAAGADETIVPRSSVWVNESAACFQFDEQDRRELCKLPITFTELWQTMIAFKKPVALEHKGLVRLLRHHLSGCVDPMVLAAFRVMDFEAMQRSMSAQNHGKQSLDAVVTSQVVGGDKPEGFTVRFPVFKNRELISYTVQVPLTVDIDAGDRKITLQAMPDTLDLALDNALEDAVGRLQAVLPAGTVILRGTP